MSEKHKIFIIKNVPISNTLLELIENLHSFFESINFNANTRRELNEDEIDYVIRLLKNYDSKAEEWIKYVTYDSERLVLILIKWK